MISLKWLVQNLPVPALFVMKLLSWHDLYPTTQTANELVPCQADSWLVGAFRPKDDSDPCVGALHGLPTTKAYLTKGGKLDGCLLLESSVEPQQKEQVGYVNCTR